jgi:hypothetical protein
VKLIDASVYHYGWVKPPQAQQAKQLTFHKLWHNDQWMQENIPQVDEFDYSSIDSLVNFKGSHPAVIKERILKMNWKFSFDPTKRKVSLKLRLLGFIEKSTGWRVGEYKNYKIV